MNDSSNMSFLLIEDDLSIREMLVLNLRHLGFSGLFYEASNGLDGLAVLNKNKNRQEKVDFVVCDIVMPQMNGMEFLSKARKIPEYEDLPILMLTSKEDREIVMECVKLQASHYLVKPWNKQALAEKIQYCLKKHNK